jgi:hypothetical protein
VRVIRSDERSLVFEFSPRYSLPEYIREGSKDYVLYDFARSSADASVERSGQPDLRYRNVAVGFPTDAGNAVQVIEADYEDIPNTMIVPVPHLRVLDGSLDVRDYAADPVAYSAGGFSGKVVTIEEVARVRSMYVGSVRIYPVLFDPSARVVRKYSRILVEVVFGAAQGARMTGEDEKLFEHLLLNHETAKNWQFARSGGSRRVGSSVLSKGFWYRIPVTSEGVYIIDAIYLQNAGLNPSTIDPRTIKIYGNGGKEVSEVLTDVRPEDLVENAIYVQGESDGVFDSDDFLVFYGKSTRGWDYNVATELHDHYFHHYSDVNYYWLTYGGTTGKRMVQQPSLSDPATVVPSHFTGLVFVNEDTINLLGSGKEWYGPTLNANASVTYPLTLTGVLPGLERTYRYSVIYRSENVVPQLVVKEGSTTLSQENLLPCGSEFVKACEKVTTVVSQAPLSGSTSQVSITLNTASPSGSAWLNWIEIQYPRSFTASNNSLSFRSPDTSGIVEYNLTGFTSTPFVLDVTVPEDARVVTGVTGAYTFRAASTAGVISEYRAVGAGGYKVPESMTFVPNQDLRGITEGYDFIILTTKEFRSAADRLAAYREEPEHGDLRTIVVDVDRIYNEFSGGLPDVTGIRDFLKYAYDNWVRVPTFVLFFGQGSYDYKSRFGFRSSYVPTWQSAISLHDINSYSSDDFFVRFSTTTSRPYLVGGRLNARTAAEADQLVTKLINYEENSARDLWKLRILIVGDDSWTPEREDGSIHTAQAESLVENNVPDEMEKRKIYIAEWPTEITAQGRRKPTAFQAIIDEINRGVLVVNFTGHGNPTVWAHEAIFNVQISIPQLVNASKLPVFFLATCNFSNFDDPNAASGSELLLNKPDGGGIGVTSATRKVFAVENFNLNVDIYERMFLYDQFGRAYLDRPATALYLSKVEDTNSTNDQKFFYMGDPTMRLQYPAGYASFDTINGQPVDTVGGVPRAEDNPIPIKALQTATMTGTLRTAANTPDTVSGGTVSLVVNDATRLVTIPGFPPGSTTPFTYRSTGATIFRGSNSVTDGKFHSTFIVPKDISYADSTTRGRVVAYYYDDEQDGVGYTGNVFVGGTDTTARTDEVGPTISLFMNSRSFRSGDPVTDDPLLIADLVDSSGINTSTSGIGHRIEAWVNGSAQSVDVTDFYNSELDDYQKGTVQYQLRDLPYGRNTLRLRAWDAFNNASTTETAFIVISGDQLSISDVMNYPNPFSRETSFTFRQNQLVPLNVSIKIYTVAGRLIQTIDTTAPGEPFVRIPWDGRDRDGDILANGVYLYKLIVSTIDRRFSSEALGKLSVLK